MNKNVTVKNILISKGDILTIKEIRRKNDLVEVLHIYLNIDNQNFLFRVKSLNHNDYYYITQEDILSKVELLEGVKLDDFK